MKRTNRWEALVVIAIALAAAGFLVASPTLFLIGTIPLFFLGYAAISTAPDPRTAVSVTRTCSPRTPIPGEPVEVILAIENVGTSAITDIRIRDAVPPELSILHGRASDAITLRAGETKELTYMVRPQRGTFYFDAALVRIHDATAARVAQASIDPAGDDTIECRVPVTGAPIHQRTIRRVGSIATDTGGPGLEFHSTRDYRQGDPPRWIDWRRFARNNELGTILYREQEGVEVVLLIDGRRNAEQVSAKGEPDGLTLSVYTAVIIASSLLEAGHKVGIATIGVRGEIPGVTPGPPAYLPPGKQSSQSAKIARLCDHVANRETRRYGTRRKTERLLRRMLPSSSQLIVCSPCTDDPFLNLVLSLRGSGFPVTVVSPDVTNRAHVGARIEAIARRSRFDQLRNYEIQILDWDPDEHLRTALDRLSYSGVFLS